jgi:hypothetical protein
MAENVIRSGGVVVAVDAGCDLAVLDLRCVFEVKICVANARCNPALFYGRSASLSL